MEETKAFIIKGTFLMRPTEPTKKMQGVLFMKRPTEPTNTSVFFIYGYRFGKILPLKKRSPQSPQIDEVPKKKKSWHWNKLASSLDQTSTHLVKKHLTSLLQRLQKQIITTPQLTNVYYCQLVFTTIEVNAINGPHETPDYVSCGSAIL